MLIKKWCKAGWPSSWGSCNNEKLMQCSRTLCKDILNALGVHPSNQLSYINYTPVILPSSHPVLQPIRPLSYSLYLLLMEIIKPINTKPLVCVTIHQCFNTSFMETGQQAAHRTDQHNRLDKTCLWGTQRTIRDSHISFPILWTSSQHRNLGPVQHMHQPINHENSQRSNSKLSATRSSIAWPGPFPLLEASSGPV